MSEIGGIKRQLNPIGKSISVFFSCLCRACVRAKLCGCVREVSPNAGGSNGEKSGSGADFAFSFLMLYACALRLLS